MFQRGTVVVVLILLVGGTVSSQQGIPKLKVEDYLAGKFSVSIGDQHNPSNEADVELCTILDWIGLRKQADRAMQNVVEDTLSKDMERHELFQEVLQVGVLLDFCEKHKNTDAALATVLVLPKLCESNKSAHEVVRDALDTIQKRFPKTWQAYIVPLAMGRVRGKNPDNTEDEVARRERFLASAPPKDFSFPEGSDMFKQVIKFMSLKTPIRAEYLICAPYDYWNNAIFGSTREKEKRLKQLDLAEKAYQRVIDEYPDSEQGKKAKKAISEEIPRIRKHIENGLL